MNQRPRIVQLEIHVDHACSLACDSCTHFSQEKLVGRHTVESFRAEMIPWSKRLLPHHFLLLGGEPTLNPDLVQICQASRELWPEVERDGKHTVTMMVVTNGSHLHKHPLLPEVLKRNSIHLDLSRHHDAPDYLEMLGKAEQWAKDNNVPIRWRESFRDWLLYYRGAGVSARPFNDRQPQQSWNHCPSRLCMQVHESKLWKCPPVTYLPLHVAKYGDGDGTWKPYLNYNALSPDCAEFELLEFIKRKAEACCGMCPANPQPFVKSNPMKRVSLI